MGLRHLWVGVLLAVGGGSAVGGAAPLPVAADACVTGAEVRGGCGGRWALGRGWLGGC